MGFIEETFARAGGGGGGSDGGGGDGIGYIIYLLFRLLFWILTSVPFPFNLIILAIIIFIIYKVAKNYKESSPLNNIPTPQNLGEIKTKGMAGGNFDETLFTSNVKKVFTGVQGAWANKDLSPVRKFISDGVYQRFNTQFLMMGKLDQVDDIEQLNIHDVKIVRFETDGKFDIVHAAISAGMKDRFYSNKYNNLSSPGGYEDFVEYWTFIRKQGVTGDLYGSDNCPKCGSPLPKESSDVCQCSYCKTYVNSGEYDWVLSEITQADDFNTSFDSLKKSGQYYEKIIGTLSQKDEFCKQLVEDKASNGYLQVLTGLSLREPQRFRRFVSDDLYQKLQGLLLDGQTFFNRIYLNNVDVFDAYQQDKKDFLCVVVKSSYQLVKVDGTHAILVNPVLTTRTEILLLARTSNAPEAVGKLYGHSCPSCGGPVENTPEIKCGYCGALLNSPDFEWIIWDILSTDEFKNFKINVPELATGFTPEKIDKLYDVRDYALNNILVICAADGNYGPEEESFVKEMANKWGFNNEKIAGMYALAKGGNLAIKMPSDPKKRQKIFALMEKAANIDNMVMQQEKDILDDVRVHFLNGRTDSPTNPYQKLF